MPCVYMCVWCVRACVCVCGVCVYVVCVVCMCGVWVGGWVGGCEYVRCVVFDMIMIVMMVVMIR